MANDVAHLHKWIFTPKYSHSPPLSTSKAQRNIPLAQWLHPAPPTIRDGRVWPLTGGHYLKNLKCRKIEGNPTFMHHFLHFQSENLIFGKILLGSCILVIIRLTKWSYPKQKCCRSYSSGWHSIFAAWSEGGPYLNIFRSIGNLFKILFFHNNL